MNVLLFYLLLPVILLTLNIKGLLDKKYVVYILMLAVTVLFYAKHLPWLLNFLKASATPWVGTDNSSRVDCLDCSEEINHVARERLNQKPSSFMGHHSGWFDPAFGSASGGSTVNATIPKWIPPTPRFWSGSH